MPRTSKPSIFLFMSSSNSAEVSRVSHARFTRSEYIDRLRLSLAVLMNRITREASQALGSHTPETTLSICSFEVKVAFGRAFPSKFPWRFHVRYSFLRKIFPRNFVG